MRLLRLAPYCFPESISSSHLDDDLNKAYIGNDIYTVLYAPVPTRGVDDETRLKYRKIKYEERYDGHQIIHRFNLVKEGRGSLSRFWRYLCMSIKHFWYGLKAKNVDLLLLGSTPPIQGAM